MFPNRPAAAWPTLVAQRGAGGLADPPASSLLSSAHSLSCSWGPCMPPRASSPYAFFLLCASPPRVHATEGAQTPTLYSLWDARGLCLLRSPGAPRRERRDLTAPACPALPNTERKTPNLPPGGRCSLASSRVRGEPQSRRETRKHWLPFPGPSPSPHRPLPKRSPALGCHSPARPAYWDSAGRRAARFPSPPPRTPPPAPGLWQARGQGCRLREALGDSGPRRWRDSLPGFDLVRARCSREARSARPSVVCPEPRSWARTRAGSGRGRGGGGVGTRRGGWGAWSMRVAAGGRRGPVPVSARPTGVLG